MTSTNLTIPRTELDAAIAAKAPPQPTKEVPVADTPIFSFALPDYMKSLFLDDKMPSTKKVAVLRALHSNIPDSVELLMDDNGLNSDQKLRILAICLESKGA